ncbi:MAG: hypothetical protein C0591_04775 [Marinilabiliales bacterium]|nr:MAG: hypothetical protein C0591_04775 [Marinilabiliales bacterium]
MLNFNLANQYIRLMKKEINRRVFLRNSGIAGISAFILSQFVPQKILGALSKTKSDISVVNGENIFNNTIKAIKMLGGMKSFVPEGAKVGLLINSDFEIPGTYTHPDVAIAVAKMCFDAGASEVITLQNVKPEYWQRSVHAQKYVEMIDSMGNVAYNQFPCEFDEAHFMISEVPGVSLKSAEVIKALFEVDILINLPIAKHHATTIYTGALKNMMGVNTRKTNVGFHLDSGIRNDPVYLAQCIADINLLRVADLTVVDVTEVLVSNGPSGPGDIEKPMKIVAGKDMVAVDAYCASLLGYQKDDILTILKASEMGIGNMNYNELKIVEV